MLPGYFITSAMAVVLTVAVSLLTRRQPLNRESRAVLDL